ncbi:MAG: hypothetical protein ABH828_02200 [archaeon]
MNFNFDYQSLYSYFDNLGFNEKLGWGSIVLGVLLLFVGILL